MPDQQYSGYWSFGHEPVMLLGASDEDNLFQDKDILLQLDSLTACGGNYVRNTMSSRDSANVWPFYKNQDGLYDLNRWDKLYWQRLNDFLDACHERNIVVQLEVWATFDFYRENWLRNPFNPKNNINYTTAQSHLPEVVDSHPTLAENDFFRSVPNLQNNIRVLTYQQKYIDKLLSVCLAYNNILYCMDNETSVPAQWGKCWSIYMQHVAAEQGKKIYTTEMWDPWDLGHIVHRETFDHPEIYAYGDISQNNHNQGDVLWHTAIDQINHLKAMGMLRPLNNVKIYGRDGGRYGNTDNAVNRFVLNVMIGSASARFHRPPSGLGLNRITQKVIRSMRDVTNDPRFFEATPANELLIDRRENQAYCRAITGKYYLIYMPEAKDIKLNLGKKNAHFSMKWMNVLTHNYSATETKISVEHFINLKPPGPGKWLAIIENK